MSEQEGIPRIEDVADALERVELLSLRIERDGDQYTIFDPEGAAARYCDTWLGEIVLTQRVIDAIKERC